jgi:hypothetical protein
VFAFEVPIAVARDPSVHERAFLPRIRAREGVRGVRDLDGGEREGRARGLKLKHRPKTGLGLNSNSLPRSQKKLKSPHLPNLLRLDGEEVPLSWMDECCFKRDKGAEVRAWRL